MIVVDRAGKVDICFSEHGKMMMMFGRFLLSNLRRYRFWLEFLNLRMGDYILFHGRPSPLLTRISQYRTGRAESRALS